MRKKLIYILILLISLVILGLSYLTYTKYDEAINRKLPSVEVKFNNEFVLYEKANYEEEVIKNVWNITKDVKVQDEKVIYHTDKAINSLKFPDGLTVNLKISLNGEEVDVYQDGVLNFLQNGLYHFEMDMQSDGNVVNKGKYHYSFDIEVVLVPKITINNLSPVLGELVEVNICDIDPASIMNITVDFTPSAVLTNGTERTFFIPITYYKAVKSYPLNIEIDGEINNYNLDVRDYEFSVISFTVSNTVTSATVDSKEANKEYREKVHPLYYTRVEDKYWDGPFVKPVEERRISSSFGQKRFINNAKTPKRHSGIDYAADCGTPIYAPNDGLVELAEFLKLSGNTIVIEHGLGLKSYYMHMDDVVVESGSMVKKGDLIGHVGTTGYSTGCHLHFQVSINNQPINPELLYE